MKRFDGILITTDLDGTLLRGDKTISAENISAIEYFKENGGFFTFVTGRPPIIVGDISTQVRPNAPIGCFNGGGIYDMQSKKYLWTKELSREALRLVEDVDKFLPDMSIQICGFENSYFCKMNPSMEKHLKIGGFPDLRCHYTEVSETISKVLFAHDDEEQIFKLRDMLSAHPLASGFDFIRSDREYYELLPKGISKAVSLTEIAKILGIDKQSTIAVGDNDNDAAMLKSAGVGIAVSNASPAAKEAADLITVSNEQHAIAKIIKDIDEGKINFSR